MPTVDSARATVAPLGAGQIAAYRRAVALRDAVTRLARLANIEKKTSSRGIRRIRFVTLGFVTVA